MSSVEPRVAVDGAEGNGEVPAPGAGSSSGGLLLSPGGKRSTSINARVLGRASTVVGVGLDAITVGADVGDGGGAPPTEGGSPSAPSPWFSFVSREDEEAVAEFPLSLDHHVRCLGPDVTSGRLGGGRGIWVVVGSLHGRLRERERRDQGQAFVVHLWCTATGQRRRPPWRSRGWPSRSGRRLRVTRASNLVLERIVSALASLRDCHTHVWPF